jgi:hypothetical protein
VIAWQQGRGGDPILDAYRERANTRARLAALED